MLSKSDVKCLIDAGFAETAKKEVLQTAKEKLKSVKQGQDKDRFMLRQHVKVSDKAIADSVEALFGCFLVHGGQDMTYKLMKWLGFDLRVSNLSIEPPASLDQKHLEDLTGKVNAAKMEEILGYTFTQKWLLVEALTHASYSGNSCTPSYERLEFLGDGVLDYIISSYLYLHKDEMVGYELDPGEMTNLR